MVRAVAQLLSSEPGSFIFGRQSGVPSGKAGAYERTFKTGADGEHVTAPWRHDPESLEKIWQEDGTEGGTKPLKVEAMLNEGYSWSGLTEEQMKDLQKEDPVRAFGAAINFTVTRV